jgi:hypothetical protein
MLSSIDSLVCEQIREYNDFELTDWLTVTSAEPSHEERINYSRAPGVFRGVKRVGLKLVYGVLGNWQEGAIPELDAASAWRLPYIHTGRTQIQRGGRQVNTLQY